VAVALMTIALAGLRSLCGKSEQDKAGDAVTQLVEARNQGDFVKVCSLITSPQLAKFKQAGRPASGRFRSWPRRGRRRRSMSRRSVSAVTAPRSTPP
jgi:hypothetical protein